MRVVADRGVGGGADLQAERLGTFKNRVIGDGHGDGLGGLVGCKVQSACGRGVVAAGGGGAVHGSEGHGGSQIGGAGLGDRESDGACGLIDDEVRPHVEDRAVIVGWATWQGAPVIDDGAHTLAVGDDSADGVGEIDVESLSAFKDRVVVDGDGDGLGGDVGGEVQCASDGGVVVACAGGGGVIGAGVLDGGGLCEVACTGDGEGHGAGSLIDDHIVDGECRCVVVNDGAYACNTPNGQRNSFILLVQKIVNRCN